MPIPSNAYQVQGQGSVTADQINTFVQWTTNAASLRSFIGLPKMLVYLEGLSVPNDGGQGFFYWLATVSETDDGRDYIIPTGASGGGWVRMGPALVLPVPAITGALSTVTDAAAKAVLTSIISALTQLGLATNGTT